MHRNVILPTRISKIAFFVALSRDKSESFRHFFTTCKTLFFMHIFQSVVERLTLSLQCVAKNAILDALVAKNSILNLEQKWSSPVEGLTVVLRTRLESTQKESVAPWEADVSFLLVRGLQPSPSTRASGLAQAEHLHLLS